MRFVISDGDRRDGGESEEQHEDKARRERSSPKPPKKVEEKTPVRDQFIVPSLL